jgi:tRNA1(Val) A37 N6-methylase TrmN6
MEVINYLLGYKNLKIYQDNTMFNFSLDSVLLPNFVTINKNITRILDIGCGNAPIPLILSTKTKAKIIGVDIQKESCLLADKSIKLNNLEKQIDIINADIKEYYKTIESDTFDIITCNPPFFRIEGKSLINNQESKSLARHELTLNLEDILMVSRKLLKNNGILALVHRPERLIDIITIMRSNNIEPKRLQFIYPRPTKEANILLIEGRKNGKPGLKICAPIYAHKANGEYTDEISQYFSNN